MFIMCGWSNDFYRCTLFFQYRLNKSIKMARVITKEILLEKVMETDVLWNTKLIIDETNMETVVSRARIVGKLEMLNELIDYINETT